MIRVVHSRTSSACLQLQRACVHVTSRKYEYAPFRVRVDQSASARRKDEMLRAAFSGAARNELVQMDVYPRACVVVSTALQSRS